MRRRIDRVAEDVAVRDEDILVAVEVEVAEDRSPSDVQAGNGGEAGGAAGVLEEAVSGVPVEAERLPLVVGDPQVGLSIPVEASATSIPMLPRWRSLQRLRLVPLMRERSSSVPSPRLR